MIRFARAGGTILLALALVTSLGRWVALEAAPAPTVIREVATDEKVVALTYDDGPHPVFTPEILRALDRYGAKATFFMVGSRMEKYPQVVKEVLAKGHAIGNHTFSHPANLELETRGQVIHEVAACEEVIWRMCGKHTELFRPPKGLANRPVLRAVGGGYKTILWTVSADHHEARTPRQMAERVISAVRPGAIVLAHDGIYPMRWRDVAATPLIIEGLRRRGYRFVTVPQLLAVERRRRLSSAASAHGEQAKTRRPAMTSPKTSVPGG